MCHSYCWSLERDRLEQNARVAGTWPAATQGLPMCHRQCYMKALVKVQNPDARDLEVVPRNRSSAEWLRMPKLEHKIAARMPYWLD